MDRLYIPVIILHLSIVGKTFYCNDNKITEFEITDSKISSTAYVILYQLIDFFSFGLEHEGGSLITPMALAHPLHPINSSAETSGLDVFPPCDLCSRPETLVLIHIYIYTYIRMHSLYEFWL